MCTHVKLNRNLIVKCQTGISMSCRSLGNCCPATRLVQMRVEDRRAKQSARTACQKCSWCGSFGLCVNQHTVKSTPAWRLWQNAVRNDTWQNTPQSHNIACRVHAQQKCSKPGSQAAKKRTSSHKSFAMYKGTGHGLCSHMRRAWQ